MQRDVGIFVWHAYPEGRGDGPGLTDPEARNTLLRKCHEAGVKGVKIDFFDSERKEIVAVCEEILRTAAEHQLMVNFHGANKPTGEVRTWPNEITREGIREQEYVLWDELPLSHYAALPFTRMVAGHADFLPGYVRPQYLRNTTAVFQMATAVVFTSPFICWPDHPDAYLESPFLSLIRDLPPVWDETRVLDGSAIGKFVALARRQWLGLVCGRPELPRLRYNLSAGTRVSSRWRLLGQLVPRSRRASDRRPGQLGNAGEERARPCRPAQGGRRFRGPIQQTE